MPWPEAAGRCTWSPTCTGPRTPRISSPTTQQGSSEDHAGLRGWSPPPTLQPDLGNASGGKDARQPSSSSVEPRHHPVSWPRLPADRYVIAADSGLDHAPALGLAVDRVVGDLDSVSGGRPAPRRALGHGDRPATRRPRTPPTPSWPSNWRSRAAAIRSIGVTGGGERLDHVLGAPARLRVTGARAGPRRGRTGTCSTSPWCTARAGSSSERSRTARSCRCSPCTAAPADGVDDRPRYPLDHESLPAGTSRGISNVGIGAPAAVSIGLGTLLVDARPTPSLATSDSRRHRERSPDASPATVVPALAGASLRHRARRRVPLRGRVRRRLAGRRAGDADAARLRLVRAPTPLRRSRPRPASRSRSPTAATPARS